MAEPTHHGTIPGRWGRKFDVFTYGRIVSIEVADRTLNIDPGEALNLADAIRLAAYTAIENRSDNA